jgi:hypothetical protein
MEILECLTKKGIYIAQGNKFPENIRLLALNMEIESEETEIDLVEARRKKALGNGTFIHYWMRQYLFRMCNNDPFCNKIADCNSSCIQRIEPGEQLTPHQDKENDEGLLYIILTYFTDNDNYSGREFYWIDREDGEIKYYKPKNGDVIILDTELKHGVNMLTSNDNITTFVMRILDD